MMDTDAKTRFKWKFYRLTVELNIIILLIAVSILVFFLLPPPLTLPCILGLLALAVVLVLDFLKKYRETKVWLDEHAGKKNNNQE